MAEPEVLLEALKERISEIHQAADAHLTKLEAA
jgi:hypothetical protein